MDQATDPRFKKLNSLLTQKNGHGFFSNIHQKKIGKNADDS